MNNNLDDIFASHLEDVKQPVQPAPQQVVQQKTTQQPQNAIQTQSQSKPKLKDQVASAISVPNISDRILSSFDKLIKEGQLSFPKGYQVGNELKSAFFKISNNSNLASCSPASIANALSDMAVQGLSVQRNQGYLIPYNGTLSFQRSYFGDIVLALRTGVIADVKARVIYEGDEYELDTDEQGYECIKNHKSSLENHDNPIKGAYAWATGINGYKMFAIMTKKEIEANWSLSKDSTRKFQKTFPQEASKRTAIRRLMKMIFNAAAVDLTEEQQQAINLYNSGMEDDYVGNNDFKFDTTQSINAQVKEETGEILDEADFD